MLLGQSEKPTHVELGKYVRFISLSFLPESSNDDEKDNTEKYTVVLFRNLLIFLNFCIYFFFSLNHVFSQERIKVILKSF